MIEEQKIQNPSTDSNTAVIEIKDLHKAFGTNEVLKGVNLTVTKGENLVILGKSGSGKSITIKCIVGLMGIDKGEINVFGTDITKFALRIWTYQRTQSVGQYALITFFSEMPAILLSPLAGTLVDRYPRKWIMVIADSTSAGKMLAFLL